MLLTECIYVVYVVIPSLLPSSVLIVEHKLRILVPLPGPHIHEYLLVLGCS